MSLLGVNTLESRGEVENVGGEDIAEATDHR